MRLLVSTGLKPSARVGDPLRPHLREVDLDRGEVVRELRREGDGPEHQEFTGCWREGGRLWQATRTAVLAIRIDELQVVGGWSHPLLYDVHSIQPRPDGGFVLSCAGHESVVETTRQGELVRHHWLRDGDFARAYPGVDDFRAVPFDRFKPHTHHPNHAFYLDGELWVTVFEERVCRCLTTPGRIELPEGPPHDGLLREGLLWFTTVTGWVIGVDPRDRDRRVELDLNRICDSAELLGWCRGVEVVGSRLFVGMTMLRSTAHREVLRRVLRGRAGVKRPTRVLEIDLDRERLVREVPVGNRAGGTIYALTAVG